MIVVNVLEAKTQLSRLLARVEQGEEIVIGRHGKPVARLVAYAEPAKRELGFLAGVIGPISDSFFFDPLPEEELRLWEGDDDAPLA